jgi:DNA invertase Pin-like site-specific DNA recombinase
MKVVIYARVSTEEQDVNKQVEECVEFCKNRGYELVGIYKDIISGAKDSRPNLDLLMKDSYSKKFDGVVVWKLDRLGRSLQHLIKIVQDWEKYNINLIVVTQQIDTTSAMGRFIFYLFGAIAEFERELISERTKLGLKKAVNVGKRGKDKGIRKKGGYHLYWKNKIKGTRKSKDSKDE